MKARTRIISIMASACLLLTMSVPGGAPAANAADAQSVQDEINNLNVQLAEAVDRYDEEASRLDELNAEIERNQADMDAAAHELGKAIGILNKRAVGIYKRGDVSSLEVIFNSKSLGDFLQQLDLLTRIGDRDAVVVRQVEEQKARIEAKARELDKQRAEQEAITEDLAGRRAEIESQLSDKQNVLASILAEIEEIDNRKPPSRPPGGGSLTCPLPGGGWSAYSPGESSDHYKYGGSGHGVWLYEYSSDGMSDAIDIGGPGDIVYAAHSGTVIWASSSVTIIQGGGYTTCYAHSTAFNGTGDYVVEGQAIAEVFAHLHFELLDGGSYVPAGSFQTYF